MIEVHIRTGEDGKDYLLLVEVGNHEPLFTSESYEGGGAPRAAHSFRDDILQQDDLPIIDHRQRDQIEHEALDDPPAA